MLVWHKSSSSMSSSVRVHMRMCVCVCVCVLQLRDRQAPLQPYIVASWCGVELNEQLASDLPAHQLQLLHLTSDLPAHQFRDGQALYSPTQVPPSTHPSNGCSHLIDLTHQALYP
jgi:hypothetical protein